jgi:hypothetical protein
VIIRFKSNNQEGDVCALKAVKIATENQFVLEITRKQNDPFWQTLECIQTCIKAKQGVGIHYYVSYSYKVPENMLVKGGDIDIDLKYDYKAIGHEYEAEVLRSTHNTKE